VARIPPISSHSDRSNSRSVEFVRSLVSRFPNLTNVLAEHIADNDEILPHLFFGDLTRYVETLHGVARADSVSPSKQELRSILAYLEETYAGGDEELQELISVSFLEHLPRRGESGWELRDMLGPQLTRQLRVIG
jgi:hypothetical protein